MLILKAASIRTMALAFLVFIGLAVFPAPLDSIYFCSVSPGETDDVINELEMEDIVHRRMRYNLFPETWPTSPSFDWLKHFSDWEPFITGLKQLAVGDPSNTECTRYPLPNYSIRKDEAELPRQLNPSDHSRLMKYFMRYKQKTGADNVDLGNNKKAFFAEDDHSFCAKITLKNPVVADRSFQPRVLCMKKLERDKTRPCKKIFVPRPRLEMPDVVPNRMVVIGYNYVGPNGCRDTFTGFFWGLDEMAVMDSDIRMGRLNWHDTKQFIVYNSKILAETGGRFSGVYSNVLFFQLVRASVVWDHAGCAHRNCKRRANELNIKLLRLSAGSEFIVRDRVRDSAINMQIGTLILNEGDSSVYNTVSNTTDLFNSKTNLTINNSLTPAVVITQIITAPSQNNTFTSFDGANPIWACSQRFMDYFVYFWARSWSLPEFFYSTKIYKNPELTAAFNSRLPCPGRSHLTYTEFTQNPRCVTKAITRKNRFAVCQNLVVLGQNSSTGWPIVSQLPLSYPGVQEAVNRYRTSPSSMANERCFIKAENPSVVDEDWRSIVPAFYPADENERIL